MGGGVEGEKNCLLLDGINIAKRLTDHCGRGTGDGRGVEGGGVGGTRGGGVEGERIAYG